MNSRPLLATSGAGDGFLYQAAKPRRKTATREAHEREDVRGDTPLHEPSSPRGPGSKNLPERELSCQMLHANHTPRQQGARQRRSLQDCPPIGFRPSIRHPYRISTNLSHSEYQREGYNRKYRDATGRFKQWERPARLRASCKESATHRSCKAQSLAGFESIVRRRSGAIGSVSGITAPIPVRGVAVW